MDTRTSGRGSVRHPQTRRLSRRGLSVIGGALLALALVSPALGHAELDSSDPENKAVLDTPPTEITLTFTEGLDAGRSSFRLLGPDGDTEVVTVKPSRDGRKTMKAEGLTLAPGTYVIRWTAGADDGHIERGTLTFTVSEPTPAPATPTPAPTEAPSAAAPTEAPATAAPTADPTPAPSADTSPAASSGTDVLIPIVAALALVGVIGFLVLRRNRAA